MRGSKLWSTVDSWKATAGTVAFSTPFVGSLSDGAFAKFGYLLVCCFVRFIEHNSTYR